VSVYRHTEAFYSARDKWYRQRLAAQAKASGLRVDQDIARKAAKWKARGARYLRRHRSVSFDPNWMRTDGRELSREVLALIEGVAPQVTQALDDVMGRTALEVWRQWPVSSGLSRSMLDVEYHIKGGDLVAALISRAPYTTFIEGQPHRRLLAAAMAARGGVDKRVTSALRSMRAGTGGR